MKRPRPFKRIAEKHSRPLKLLSSSFLLGLLILLITISSMFQNVMIGEVAIGIYGLAAITFKIPSSTTFKMVFITLISIPLIAIFKPDSSLGDTFAVYAYLLIAVGIVTSVIEYWRNSRNQKNKVM